MEPAATATPATSPASASPSSTAPSTPGNPQGAAPGAGQPAQTPSTGTTGTPASQPSVSPEDLKKVLSFQESDGARAERLEKQYAASSSEAKRLKAQHDELIRVLGEQKVKVEFTKDGKVKSILPGEGYSDNIEDLKLDINSLLSKSEREALTDNPEKVINDLVGRVLDKAKKAFVRVAPTSRNTVEPLSPEREAAVFDFVKGSKFALDGSSSFPDFAQDAEFLKYITSDPTLPEAIREAYYRAPEQMAELFYTNLVFKKSQLSAYAARQADAATKKAAGARDTASLGPEGAGRTVINAGDAAAAARGLSEKIAEAAGRP
jgi:hypothetical protein